MEPKGVDLRIALVLLLAISGCRAGSSDRGSAQPLRASTRPTLRDLPVPGGFRVRRRWEGSSRVGGGRVVRHEYVGWGEVEALVAFYRREMPLVRWREIDAASSKGRYRLLFDRGEETCRIMVYRAGPLWFGRSVVEAQIAPRGSD